MALATVLPPAPIKLEFQAPTRKYVLDTWRELERLYDGDDKQIKRMRLCREQKNRVVLPDKHRLVQVEIRDPTVSDECQRTTATLSVNPPKLKVSPGRPGDAADENATLREHWTEAVLTEAGAREPGVPTFQKLVDAVVADGGGWTQFLYDKDVWEERFSLDPFVGNDPAGEPYSRFEDPPPDTPDHLLDEVDDPNDDDDESELMAGDAAGADPIRISDGMGREEMMVGRGRNRRKKIRVTDWKRFNSDTEDAKRESGVPFTWRHVDALTVYPVFRGRRIAEMIEVSERPLLSTFRQYRLTSDQDGKIRRLRDDEAIPEELLQRGAIGSTRSLATVRFIEHWDAKYVSYIVVGGKGSGRGLYDLGNAEIVNQWEHGLGRVPYFWSPGLWQNQFTNRKVGWGVSQSKLWLVEYRSFLLTVHAQVVARDAFPPLFREVPVQDAQAAMNIGNARQPKKSSEWALGEIIEGQAGEKLGPITFPNVGQALREEIQLITEMIEKLEAPRVSNNIGSNVEGAGFAINQLLAEAKIRFDPLAQSIERSLEEITRFLWEMVRTVVKEDVWVYRSKGSKTGWKVAGPADLKPGVAITWSLDPAQPSAKLIEERYWHERLKAGTASLDQAISEMGDNPDEVRIGRALDAVRASPLYQAWIVNEVLSMAGRGDLIRKTKAAEQMADSGNIPPPGGAGGMGGQNGAPDMGTLAVSPQGAGAAPATPTQVGIGAPNGAVSGAGPGAVVPTAGAAAAAGLQPVNAGR